MASVARATLLISVLALLGKIAALVRDMVVAAKFGMSGKTDAYLAAYQIPGTLSIILGAVLATVVIPVFVQYLTASNEKQAWRTINVTVTYLFLCLLILSGLAILFAGPVVHVLRPGWLGEKFDLTVRMLRIFAPVMILNGVAGILSGILNARQRFVIPAALPMLTSSIVIIGMLAFYRQLGIYGLVFSLTLAPIVGILILLYNVTGKRGHLHLNVNFKDKGFRRVIVLLATAMVGMAVGQINLLTDGMFVSFLPTGSNTALDNATKMALLPQGIFVASLETALYPVLSAQAATQRFADMRDTIIRGLRSIWIFVLPVALTLIVMAVPILQLVYERGKFTHHDTLLSAQAMMYLAAGIVAYSFNDILIASFYSMQDRKTPIKIAVITVSCNVLFSYLLMLRMGVGGLTFGTTIATVVGTILYVIVLQRRTGKWPLREQTGFIAKVAIAAVVGVAPIAFLRVELARWLGDTELARLVCLAVAGIVGAGLYFAMLYLLRITEVSDFGSKVLHRFRGSKMRDATH